MAIEENRENSRRIIVVTGAPRSGTTIAGHCLAAAPHAAALHEPLNFHVGLRDVDAYFQVPGAGICNDLFLDGLVKRIGRLDLNFKPGLFPNETGLRRGVKKIIGGRAINSWRRCCITPGLKTIIWKDPFASFLSGALTNQHDIHVVAAVRNPFAVTASFKRMGWAFDLEDIFGRLRLAGFYDGPPIKNVSDPVLNGAYLWQAIYSFLASKAKDNKRLHWLFMDDVVAGPEICYRGLYDKLGLAWTPKAAKRIAQSHAGQGRAAPRAGIAHDRQLDYRQANLYWKTVLSEDETTQASKICGGLWEQLSSQSAHGSAAV